LVRYYGAYSNVSRGKRKKEKVEEGSTEVGEVPPPPVSKELRRRWSQLIQKVYETDPLICPKCRGEMRIISLCEAFDYVKWCAADSFHLLVGYGLVAAGGTLPLHIIPAPFDKFSSHSRIPGLSHFDRLFGAFPPSVVDRPPALWLTAIGNAR